MPVEGRAAKWASTCSICGKRIQEGDMQDRPDWKNEPKKYAHVACISSSPAPSYNNGSSNPKSVIAALTELASATSRLCDILDAAVLEKAQNAASGVEQTDDYAVIESEQPF